MHCLDAKMKPLCVKLQYLLCYESLHDHLKNVLENKRCMRRSRVVKVERDENDTKTKYASYI